MWESVEVNKSEYALDTWHIKWQDHDKFALCVYRYLRSPLYVLSKEWKLKLKRKR